MAAGRRKNATRNVLIAALEAAIKRVEEDPRSDAKSTMFFVIGYMGRCEPEIATLLEKLMRTIKD